MSGKITDKLTIILPGLLVAATGVGAGDLATASFTGSQLGVAVLWAVVLGGLFKFVLTEGLARWQLATGSTFLEGATEHFGRWLGWLFLPYLFLWTFFVGSALMSACGATLHALIPIFDSPYYGKIVFGVISSILGLILVLGGGFKLFEKIMSVAIVIMFATVLLTAFVLWPGTTEVMAGLFVPTIPNANGDGLSWTIALMGGVGGTLTILCYGYWIEEAGRDGEDNIQICRIDLGVGYAMTIIFGLAMVIIGSSIAVDGRGAGLLVSLSDRLEEQIGAMGSLLFLLGALSAVFSSLLGVWQSVPYLFADIWRLSFGTEPQGKSDLTHTKPYKIYLWVIATLPALGLLMSFKEVQKLYAIIGAGFMPLLALALLTLNGNKKWVGGNSNGYFTTLMLLATLGFFSTIAWMSWVT